MANKKRLLRAALGLANSTYFPSVVAIGDSITAADEDAANQLHANSYITFAALALGQAGVGLNILRNSGIGGNTSTDMKNRFATDVTAYSPKIVAMGPIGTNDNDPEVTRANLITMINSSKAMGALAVLGTIPPAGTPAISAPTAAAVGAITGGSLAAGTYSYRISAINGANGTGGETTAAAAVTGNVASGTTGAVTLSWPAVEGATGYKIYGRSAGSELLIATTGAFVLSGQNRATCGYVDTGSVTPSGALPGANTTAVTLTGAVATKIAGVNTVVQQLAAQYGLPYADFYTLLVDSQTGMYQTGYTKDGTHPTPKASRLMGQLWANTIKRYLQVRTPYLAAQNADPTCLYNNAWFSNNNGAVPSNWASVAEESVITVPGENGRVFRLTNSGFSTRNNTGPTGGFVGISAGERIALSGRIKVTGADVGGGQADIKCKNNNNVQFLVFLLNSDTPNSDWCPFYFEAIAPASSTSMYFQIDRAFGNITVQFDQLTVRNLTTLGSGGAF